MQEQAVKQNPNQEQLIKQGSNEFASFGLSETPNQIDISFENISYQIKDKKILRQISGVFKNNKLNVIMGSSGCGKTSLLNIVAKRIAEKNVAGKLYMNNYQYSDKDFSNVAGYVMQQDEMLQYMTPREMIQFVADLKYFKNDKQSYVEQIIQDFKLVDCQNTYIGGVDVKGISGGEKKRTAIAMELIKQPDILVLDEPTSGLDSLTSFIIVDILKNFSIMNKTVIMTIHQPNQEIYDMFDRLILMSEGSIVYQGDSCDIPKYLQNLNYTIPEYSSIPDYLMQILHPEHDKENLEKRLLTFRNYYQENQAKQVQDQINNRSNAIIEVNEQKQASRYQEFYQIFKRTITNQKRNPIITKGRLFSTIVLGLISGFVWFQIDNDPFDTRGSIDRCAALFFLCMNNFFQSFQPVVLQLPSERNTFLREENSRLYRVLPYFLGRTIPELAYVVFFPTLLVSISYFLVNLNHSEPQLFPINLLCCIVISFAGNSYATLLGSLVGDQKLASALAPTIFLPLLLTSGFYSNKDTLPIYLRWIYYINPFAFAFSTITHNEFDNRYTLADPLKQFNSSTHIWDGILINVAIACIIRLLALGGFKLSTRKVQ